MLARNFKREDLDVITEKIFSSFDKDRNGRFSRLEFPKVIRSLAEMIGGEITKDDIEDIFNLIDVNGD